METFLITNGVSGLKFVEINGRQFAVAPMTILKSRVLPGSRGPLFYPVDENKKTQDQWNGRPLVATTHPRSNGQNISANTPEIFQNQEIGRFYNSKVDNQGTNTGEGWFDAELTKKHDIRIWNALVTKQKIEVSTGLYTDNEDAPDGSSYDNVPYTHIARNYRPDHIAVLVGEPGACSIKDGCGVNNASFLTTNPAWVKDHAKWEKAKAQAEQEGKSSDYAYITGIYKQMGGEVDNHQNNNSSQSVTCAYCGAIQNTSAVKDGICSQCQQPIQSIPNTKETIMNERNNIIAWLTTNACSCKGKTLELNSLTDSALKEVLLENAEKAAENDADQSFLNWISNADKEIKNAFVGMLRNKLKGAVNTTTTKNTFPPTRKPDPNQQQPADTSGSDADTAQADDMEKKKQAMMQANNSAHTNEPKTLDEFVKRYPFLSGLVTNHQTIEGVERQQLIGKLTAHITDNSAKQQAATALTGKPIDDLRLMASLIPIVPTQQQTNNQQSIPYAQPIANFFGAAGVGAPITDNSYLQKEQLVCSVPDWSGWAKDASN